MEIFTKHKPIYDYNLSFHGDRYIDNFYREYRDVDGRAEAAVAWLWDIRESGDILGATGHLINNVGQDAASKIFNWAVEQRYLEKREKLKEPPTTSTRSEELLWVSLTPEDMHEQTYGKKNIGQAGTHHITDEDFI